LLVAGAADVAAAQTARDLYTRALAKERAVRDAERPQTIQQIRSAIDAYERVVRRYPASGYADNALWQAGHLSLLAYERFGQASDKRTGLRLLNLLKSEYPSSSLVGRLPSALAQFENARAAAPPVQRRGGSGDTDPQREDREAPRRAAPDPPQRALAPAAPSDPPVPAVSRRPLPEATPSATPAVIRGITRTPLDDGIRVTIEVDRELFFHQEPLENPRRLFFDLKGAHPSEELRETALRYPEDVVREIRLGRHPQDVTRVVMDTEGVASYSVFTLYNPFRVIVDFKRSTGATPAAVAVPTSGPAAPAPKPVGDAPSTAPAALTPGAGAAADATSATSAPLPSRAATRPELAAPAVPSVNSNGQFSLARQLGLGISRIVIDAGHGGHDPGARGNGVNEAELTLDVAQRLKQLLEKQPGVGVVMTRQTDVYVPLEERTAIANREAADLFLSIHANASRNPSARGIETYFLNFATNPEAEAVAARENAASGKTMHNLPSIVRAIALNNKIDESRDFAATVQKSMIGRLSVRNKQVRDLGVKQAPFVVLIGAGMPSVLAEISFLTHKQEGQLLKMSAYRQTIAEALFDAILRYQRSLKAKSAIAMREEN
jgi:N-acetylmuramoyl-L-alanine amidase